MNPPIEESGHAAIGLAAETVGELVSFWGFKSSMGRIWTLLYLSSQPLPADVIAVRTGLSSGAVSMALGELAQWGIVTRAPTPSERKRHYQAETEVWSIVRRIFRERELKLVERSVHRFGRAIEILEQAQALDPDDGEIAFMLGRLRGLHDLARIGHSMVKRLAESGILSLLPIRGALSRFER